MTIEPAKDEPVETDRSDAEETEGQSEPERELKTTLDNESDAEEAESALEKMSDTDKSKIKKKKKKVKYIDDGHTVYSMEGLDEARGIKKRGESIKLNRKEKWAAIRAAFARFFPIFLGVVGCFSLTALLLYFWLK